MVNRLQLFDSGRLSIAYLHSKIWFIRLMRRWTKQIRALELFGEKNRLGRGSNLGQAGGNLCLWGPERFFSIVRNAQYTYPLFGRAQNMTLSSVHAEKNVILQPSATGQPSNKTNRVFRGPATSIHFLSKCFSNHATSESAARLPSSPRNP